MVEKLNSHCYQVLCGQLAIRAANGWRMLFASSNSSTIVYCSLRQVDERTVCHVLRNAFTFVPLDT
uniref:PID domain-containing protein n=1 Tax=Glossina palpalis gambiensis TaxID=67801 RepID=A0A1B0BJX7_9MUSC